MREFIAARGLRSGCHKAVIGATSLIAAGSDIDIAGGPKLAKSFNMPLDNAKIRAF